MFEEAKDIKSFRSWTEVSRKIVKTAEELLRLCPPQLNLDLKRQFVFGGLVALNSALDWDMVTQPEETENQILWMFVQLYVR